MDAAGLHHSHIALRVRPTPVRHFLPDVIEQVLAARIGEYGSRVGHEQVPRPRAHDLEA
ncbi:MULTISPECIES: hypothetical protein [unclassified Streptomyces]|uniref:hypothetical protein n=1 Tax=unclassified Streptomyces TaxID=2593676 RepID=UPI000A6E7F46|nr:MULTISPECIES: hypothetical protein [unclassified Streptomyces]